MKYALTKLNLAFLVLLSLSVSLLAIVELAAETVEIKFKKKGSDITITLNELCKNIKLKGLTYQAASEKIARLNDLYSAYNNGNLLEPFQFTISISPESNSKNPKNEYVASQSYKLNGSQFFDAMNLNSDSTAKNGDPDGLNFKVTLVPGVDVPPLEGLSLRVAKQELKRVQLKLSTKPNITNDSNQDQDIYFVKANSQSPKAGEKVAPNTSVEFELVVKVPKIEGLALDKAINLLIRNKLKPDTHYLTYTSQSSYFVKKQYLSPGTKVDAGSIVQFDLNVEVPNVEGLSLKNAIKQMNNRKLNLDFILAPNLLNDQDIYFVTQGSQIPKGGSKVDLHSSVQCRLSLEIPKTEINLPPIPPIQADDQREIIVPPQLDPESVEAPKISPDVNQFLKRLFKSIQKLGDSLHKIIKQIMSFITKPVIADTSTAQPVPTNTEPSFLDRLINSVPSVFLLTAVSTLGMAGIGLLVNYLRINPAVGQSPVMSHLPSPTIRVRLNDQFIHPIGIKPKTKEKPINFSFSIKVNPNSEYSEIQLPNDQPKIDTK